MLPFWVIGSRTIGLGGVQAAGRFVGNNDRFPSRGHDLLLSYGFKSPRTLSPTSLSFERVFFIDRECSCMCRCQSH